MKDKIFIVGVGRSGTSLLQSMLNAHSKVAFIPETHFLRKYVFKKNVAITPENKNGFLNELKNDLEFNRTKIEPENIVHSGNTYLQTYNLLLENYLKSKGKDIIGDKDPRNIDFISQLNHFFPEAKVLHIIRDPRDVVLSRTKADWSKHWPFGLHAYLYNTQIQMGRKKGIQLFGDNYLEIYYESLIEQPVEELKRVCTFIGVDYEQEMLNFGKSAKELVDKREMQWKKETLGPLLSTNKNKWKTSFSSKQIDLIQKVCGYSFQSGQYQREEVKTNFINIFHIIGAQLFKWLYPLRIKSLKK